MSTIAPFIPAASEALRLTSKTDLKAQAQGKGKAAVAAQAELDRRVSNRARKAALKLAGA